MPDHFNPRWFVSDVMRMMREGCDVDGGDLQNAAERHGLLHERPLTVEEIADKDGPWHEFGCKEGDVWTFWTDDLKAWLNAS